MCVKRARYKNKHGKRKSETWVYAYWGIAPKRVDWVKDTYRRRFGIETSYRQMNQCRIRTTTKKFHVRFFYVAIGLLLRNLWVWLHYFVLSSPRRGRRRFNWDLLRVERMLIWLEEVAKSMYGLVDSITTERSCTSNQFRHSRPKSLHSGSTETGMGCRRPGGTGVWSDPSVFRPVRLTPANGSDPGSVPVKPFPIRAEPKLVPWLVAF